MCSMKAHSIRSTWKTVIIPQPGSPMRTTQTWSIQTRPTILQMTTGGHYGYGICQWTYPTRKTEFRKFCKDRGVSVGDLDTQIDFMIMELKRDFSATWNALKTSNSGYNCAWQFCRWFENPANPEGQAQFRASNVEPMHNFIVQHIDDEDSPVDPTPAPEPTPVEDHSLVLRTIDSHCSGWDEVFLLQTILMNRKYKIPQIDGIWMDGDETDQAVLQFQKDNNLVADKCVGTKTWDALLKR